MGNRTVDNEDTIKAFLSMTIHDELKDLVGTELDYDKLVTRLRSALTKITEESAKTTYHTVVDIDGDTVRCAASSSTRFSRKSTGLEEFLQSLETDNG